MNRDDLRQGWARLRGIYDRMPDFDTAIVGEWLRVLKPFSGADLDDAISMWIDNKKFKPSPADLAAYCRKAQHMRREAEITAEVERNGVCPWCGGLGYVGKFLEPEDRDVYFYCQCARSPNRERGAEILAAARADGAWVFDKVNHGFRRRRGWIGDEQPDNTPVPLDEQKGFWREAARIGRVMK